MVHSKHATAHISATHDMTDGTEKNDFYGTGDGRRDGKNIMAVTNIL